VHIADAALHEPARQQAAVAERRGPILGAKCIGLLPYVEQVASIGRILLSKNSASGVWAKAEVVAQNSIGSHSQAGATVRLIDG